MDGDLNIFMEEVMVTTRVKGSTIFLRFSYYIEGIAKKVEVSSEFKCTGKGGSTCRCEGHKSAIGLANAVSTAISDGSFVFEKFFPKSLRARKKSSTGLSVSKSSISSANKSVFGFVADTITADDITTILNDNFANFTDIWFQNADLTKSTKLGYKNIIKNYLKPAFGNMLLKDIKLSHIQSFQNKLINKYSNKYINNIMGCLSSIMTYAVQNDIISQNPCSQIKKQRVKLVTITPYNSEEIDKILEYSKEHYPNWTLFFAFGLFEGLRTGEIFALTWNDFKLLDEHNNLIQLKSKEALESALSDEKSKLCIEISKTITSGELKNSTKTDRTRMLHIQSVLKPYIKEHFDKYNNDDIAYLFYTKAGVYYKRYPSAAKKWSIILKACNIEHRQLYQNRHNFAINFLKAGATHNQAARMLGHTTSAMVISRYGNYQEDIADMDFLK